jgi:hypothetical protein
MVSMSTQLLFGLLLLLLFGWCDVCVVVCVCFPSSKYRYKAMVNAKVEYMYMTQLKASVLSSGAMTIWLWSLVANNYSKLLGVMPPVFLGPGVARHATPCHVLTGHRACLVGLKTWHGVARVKISAPRVARHAPCRATFTRKRGMAWHCTPCHVPRRAMS